MGTPTQAEAITQLQDQIRLYKDLRTALTVTFAANQTTAEGNLVSNVADAKTAGWAEQRTQLADGWLNSTALDSHITDWVDLADKPVGLDLQASIDIMMGYWRDNGLFVTSRGFTTPTPVAGGGNVGDGRIVRLPTDRFGDPIETGVGADDYTARCTADANTGTERSEELFTIRSGSQDPTGLEAKGAGLDVQLESQHPDGGLLDNQSFDQFGSDPTAPTGITAWDTSIVLAGDGSDVAGDDVNIYLPKKRATENRYSLNIKTTITLTQRFDRGGSDLNQIGPLFLELAYNRSIGAAAGALALTIGSKTVTVPDLTVVPAGWNLLRCLITAPEDAWYKNFAADPLSVSIAATILGGELRIDDLQLFELTFVANSWWGIVPAQTPFRAGTESGDDGDVFTWSDTATEAGIIQREFAIRTGRYFPTTGSTLVTDP